MEQNSKKTLEKNIELSQKPLRSLGDDDVRRSLESGDNPSGTAPNPFGEVNHAAQSFCFDQCGYTLK